MNPDNTFPPYRVTLKQVSTRCGLSERTIMRMVKRGEFPVGEKLNNKWWWPRWKIDKWIATQGKPVPPPVTKLSFMERVYQWVESWCH